LTRFLPTLERLEGNIASEAISPLVQAYIVDFGSRSILNQYVWETKDVGDVAERLPTPGTKTRIIYIGYNMEKEGEHGLFLSLIDSLGIHLDLEPSFVDAVLLKMSKGVGRRDPSPKRFLDLNLEGTDVGWTGRSMDAIICIKEPKFEGTSSLQFRKFSLEWTYSSNALLTYSQRRPLYYSTTTLSARAPICKI
jgi:hypothetical protein